MLYATLMSFTHISNDIPYYGNYSRYFRYQEKFEPTQFDFYSKESQEPKVVRTSGLSESRLESLELCAPNIFRNRNILDIGCNIGDISLTIAAFHQPNRVWAFDLDKNLIDRSIGILQNIRLIKNCRVSSSPYNDFTKSQDGKNCKFDSSIVNKIANLAHECKIRLGRFPYNISFFVYDALSSDQFILNKCPNVNTILILGLFKWIHLIHGDKGISEFIIRVARYLGHGSYVVIELFNKKSYKKAVNIIASAKIRMPVITIRPEHILEDMSTTFVEAKLVYFGIINLLSKNYKRKLLILTKV